MSVTALTSAEISLPAEADGQRVSDRIAVLADTVDVVGLTDNHAGQPRMSPLAAVALAREQGVGTIVHVSCRDRNRLALQSQVVGAAALGAEGVLCMQGDPVAGVDHVADMTATELIARAPGWSVPHSLAVGAVVNPFAEDLDRELRLLQRKVAAGATFVQSQMVFDLPRLEAFLARGEDMLAGVRVYASVALLRSERMAERACALPGVTIPEPACAQIRRGGGIELARELAAGLARRRRDRRGPRAEAQFHEIEQALPLIEAASVVLIALIVALAFRSIGAPLVALAAAGVAYAITMRVLPWLGERANVTVPKEIEPVVVVLLLGLVTDYSIFFLSETRRRLRAGDERLPAARGAIAEVAPIVITAGLIVAAGTAALVVGHLQFFRAFGPGLAATTLITLAVAVTLVPALVALFGPRLFGKSVRPRDGGARPRCRQRGRTALGRRARCR